MPSLRFAQPFRIPAVRSDRAREVARYFEILDRPESQGIAPEPETLCRLLPPAGGITLITGASGSGKTSLLRALRDAAKGERFLDLQLISPAEVPIVDLFPHLPLQQAMGMLSQVGLTEAWTYLRTPRELSDGQRWRLKLAIGIEQAGMENAIIVCDEFAALLDRITARIVANRFFKRVKKRNLRAILATSHDDLTAALHPVIRVRCDFNETRVM